MAFSSKCRSFSDRLSLLRMGILGLMITAGTAQAAILQYTPRDGTDKWKDQSNWDVIEGTKEAGLPDANDIVWLRNDSSVRVTAEAVAKALKIGKESTGSVLIDGGTLHTTGMDEFTVVGDKAPGRLTIQNGGSLTCDSNFSVGSKDSSGSSVIIHKGLLRVANCYYHNEQYAGAAPIDTRTTIHTDGILEAERIELNAGVIDIAGGTVKVLNVTAELANQWIAEGKVIAMGGQEGWIVKVTTESDTGLLVMTAEAQVVAADQEIEASGQKIPKFVVVGLIVVCASILLGMAYFIMKQP